MNSVPKAVIRIAKKEKAPVTVLFNPLFYRKSFKAKHLPASERQRVFDICKKEGYQFDNADYVKGLEYVQFIRTTFNYFKMLYCGRPTGYGYFINSNKID